MTEERKAPESTPAELPPQTVIDWETEGAPVHANVANIVQHQGLFAITLADLVPSADRLYEMDGRRVWRAKVVSSVRVMWNFFLPLAMGMASRWNEFASMAPLAPEQPRFPKFKLLYATPEQQLSGLTEEERRDG
ncbi:MAG: hypothetical protein HY909_20835 [Deltaproteobacteria bacterium]|nr:hypothetical protein [Deltaproteobacteria bacterium]